MRPKDPSPRSHTVIIFLTGCTHNIEEVTLIFLQDIQGNDLEGFIEKKNSSMSSESWGLGT